MTDHPTPPTDWTALARYLSGESEPGEADAIRRWIDASPERAELVDGLRRVWAEAAVPREEWDVEAGLGHILGGLPRPTVRLQPTIASRQWRWLGQAVAAAVVIAGGFTVWRVAVSHPQPLSAAPVREYATVRGQYATFVLVDGTRITLGPMSRLRAARDVEGAARDVYLDGQALFKVTHDSQRPFRVHTLKATATDLGTTFAVRAYADMARVDVAVAEGSVSFASPSAATPIVLRPGDLGRANGDGTIGVEHGVPLDAYTAWADGQLVFRLTPLREVVAELSRWYDLDVRITDSAVAERRVTASFRNEPAAEVVRLIALSLGLRYERVGRTIVLSPTDR